MLVCFTEFLRIPFPVWFWVRMGHNRHLWQGHCSHYIAKAACISLIDDPLVHLVRERSSSAKTEPPGDFPLQLLWALGHRCVQFWGEGYCLLQITCVHQNYRCKRQTWSPFFLVGSNMSLLSSASLQFVSPTSGPVAQQQLQAHPLQIQRQAPSRDSFTNPYNRVRSNSVLSSIGATSHVWLLTIQLIKIIENWNSISSVVLATFHMCT